MAAKNKSMKAKKLNGLQLAEVIDVAPSTLSSALQRGYKAGGHNIKKWAVRNSSGRVTHYNVPRRIIADSSESDPKRGNTVFSLRNVGLVFALGLLVKLAQSRS